MPETRSVLMSDARGIPCLHLLQQKKQVSEISDLLATRIHPDAEIAGAKSNVVTRAVKKMGRSLVNHRASNKNIIAQANKTVEELTCWMERFKGVATKYLQQYWDWFRVEINAGSLEKFQLECFGQRQLQTYRKLILT